MPYGFDQTAQRQWGAKGSHCLHLRANSEWLDERRAGAAGAARPRGNCNGGQADAIDAAGNAFVVAEPTDKTAPDYAEKKKEYDEYQAQAAKEPLAVKLADTVGHIRIATNFSWTLITGYLVLFMQAGFALLTCGLVRKKNAGASHDA